MSERKSWLTTNYHPFILVTLGFVRGPHTRLTPCLVEYLGRFEKAVTLAFAQSFPTSL